MADNKKIDPLGGFLVRQVERYLTYRERKQYIAQVKAKRRGIVLDWLIALLWAVGWVFLINQYLVQAYQIPSESMEKTLNVGDRIFVNKLIFGPELLPNLGKIPSPIKPERGNIIIFQSPEYQSGGVAFEVVHRLLYMVSFSLINLNRNAVDLLIKRAVGTDGDQIIMRHGDFYIKARGEQQFIKESEFLTLSGKQNRIRRLLREEDYENSRLWVIRNTYYQARVELPPALSYLEEANLDALVSQGSYIDINRVRQSSESYEQLRLVFQFYPWVRQARSAFLQAEQGIYVPDGSILPLGDNRDNSHDGRMWGVISQNKVLGKAWLRFWPLSRLGSID